MNTAHTAAHRTAVKATAPTAPVTDQEIRGLKDRALNTGDRTLTHCCFVALSETKPGEYHAQPDSVEKAREICAETIDTIKKIAKRDAAERAGMVALTSYRLTESCFIDWIRLYGDKTDQKSKDTLQRQAAVVFRKYHALTPVNRAKVDQS